MSSLHDTPAKYTLTATSVVGAVESCEPVPSAEARFQRQGVIAVGGMGSIVHAYDVVLQRHVALKTMRSEIADRAREGDALLREARLTAQLEHPNIVPVHDLVYKADSELPGFAMKLVHGQSLADRVRALGEARLESAELSRLIDALYRVCDAISFAHARGVLHLDLKPDNVMIESGGQVYVMDWGVALRCARGADGKLAPVESHRGVRGTHAYMPLEQFEAGMPRVDERSDVHGLGGILYHLLTGKAPFKSMESLDDARSLRDLPIADPATLVGERAPAGLVRVAMRALAKHPDDRHPSVDAFKQEIEEVMSAGGSFRTRHFAAGAEIVREGDPADEAYLLLEGECDVFRREGTGERHLRRMRAGEMFGESMLLAEPRRTASVIAASEVTVLVFTRSALEQELAGRGWLGSLVRSLAERFREADDERFRLRAQPTPRRKRGRGA